MNFIEFSLFHKRFTKDFYSNIWTWACLLKTFLGTCVLFFWQSYFLTKHHSFHLNYTLKLPTLGGHRFIVLWQNIWFFAPNRTCAKIDHCLFTGDWRCPLGGQKATLSISIVKCSWSRLGKSSNWVYTQCLFSNYIQLLWVLEPFCIWMWYYSICI